MRYYYNPKDDKVYKTESKTSVVYYGNVAGEEMFQIRCFHMLIPHYFVSKDLNKLWKIVEKYRKSKKNK